MSIDFRKHKTRPTRFRSPLLTEGRLALLAFLSVGLAPVGAQVVFETTSPYHHIRVVDRSGLRILFFDDAPETQVSLQDPLKGHFEYTDFFHLAWLWNARITNVLMIGLGGGSAQRSFAHYYPDIFIQSVEIDPVVVQVAQNFFQFTASDHQKVQTSDGRVFLRRTKAQYDVIVLDAYVQGRYGSGIPQHLATREFFEIVRDHLSTNGVVAYNVIGSMGGWRADIVGAVYRTLRTVFPQVYCFPARSSQNIVLLGTKAPQRADLAGLRQRAEFLMRSQRIRLPAFRERLESFQSLPPVKANQSPILTDDYAPVEGLAAGGGP
jgi:spermidine synthase